MTNKDQNNQNKLSYNFIDIINKNLDETYEVCGEGFDVVPDKYALGFSYFNPNPRGGVTGDCIERVVVVVVVVATGKDYRELELFMNLNKVDKKRSYNFKENFEHSIELLGGVKFLWQPQQELVDGT